MRRRTLIAALGTAAATGLAGCTALADGSNSGSPPDGETAVVRREVARNVIRVSAAGRVESDPNRAVASVSVEARAGDAETVRQQLAEDAAAVKEALLEFGLEDEDVTTERFDIRQRSRSNDYRGVHSYRVEIGDPDEVGRVVDAAVEAGADDVGRIAFTLGDERRDELRREAIELALEGARREAEAIAAAEGVELRGVESIDASGGRVSPHRSGYAYATAGDAEGAAAPTRIDEGPVSVSASVTVVYRFAE